MKAIILGLSTGMMIGVAFLGGMRFQIHITDRKLDQLDSEGVYAVWRSSSGLRVLKLTDRPTEIKTPKGTLKLEAPNTHSTTL